MNLPQNWTELKFASAIEKVSILNEIKIKRKNYLSLGTYPIIDQGESFIGGYTNDNQKIINCKIPAIVFGDHTRCVKFLSFDFCAGADGIKVFNHIGCYNSKLFFYFVQVLAGKILNKGYARHYQHLEKETIPIPPLPEQHRIVAKIDTLFSELDDAVALLKTIKAQLSVYRKAILKWAFEGKNKKIVQLCEIADIVGGITKGRNLEKYETVFLPYLSVANVQDGYLNLTNVKKIKLKLEEKEKYLLQLNDVLYTEGGDKDKLGRGTIWKNEINECVHQNHIFRARIDTKKALPKYVALFSLTKSAKDYFFSRAKQTVNLASINMTVLRSLPIPLPSLNEQLAIVSAIESRLSVCDKLEQTIDQTLALSASLRQSILKKAFEGRLVPQDPNDESAEKLLERIKAEKATVLAKQKQTRKRSKK
jgi:type I restriction enzyme S subunit